MQKFIRSASVVLFLTFAMFGNRVHAAQTPIFRQSFGITNANLRLHGFNNAGDLLVEYYDATEQRTVGGVLHNGTFLKIAPALDIRVTNTLLGGISQRRPNGNVYVAGTAYMTDGFYRACVWDLAPDGTYSFSIAKNIVLPDESQAPGEQYRADGVAINTSGVMVGSGASYLIYISTRWIPPYDTAERFSVASGSIFMDINEDGTMLANGVEFDHFSDRDRYSAAIFSPSGNPTEIPLLDPTPGILNPEYAQMMRGDWVTGNGNLSGASRAFVWKMGWGASVNLPNPAFAPNAQNTDGLAINASGNVLGRVNGGTGSGLLIYWANQGASFIPYAFGDLLPTDSNLFNSPISEAFINDVGQVAVTISGFDGTILRVYDPVNDGIVQFSEIFGAGTEETGSMTFKVKLARAPQNNGLVTVNFQTVDETATAPAYYTAVNSSVSWAAGESGEKTIVVPVVNNLTFDEDKHFKVRLTGATGAQLDGFLEATGYFFDPYQEIVARDQIPNDGGYGVGVIDGASEVILQFERTGGTDGKLTLTNFHSVDITARAGSDYQLPPNLSFPWAPGEGGVKTLNIPLTPGAPITSAKAFGVTADVILEGASFPSTIYAGVVILQKQNQTAPVVNSSEAALVSNKLKFTVSAPEGSIVQLQSLAALGATWGIESEATVANGEVTFEITVDPAMVERFFQVRSKP